MFWRREKKIPEAGNMLENMKKDIETGLGSRGIAVSGVNIRLEPDNLYVSIYINSSKRLV